MEALPEVVQRILTSQVGPFTVLQWVGGAIVVSILLRVYGVVAARSRAARDAKQSVAAKCFGCGWNGKVSRFTRTCPKCGDRVSTAS